jgi:hypothetical protein
MITDLAGTLYRYNGMRRSKFNLLKQVQENEFYEERVDNFEQEFLLQFLIKPMKFITFGKSINRRSAGENSSVRFSCIFLLL